MQYCRRESCEPRLGRKRTRKRGLAGVCGVTGSSSSSVNRWCLRAAEAEVPPFSCETPNSREAVLDGMLAVCCARRRSRYLEKFGRERRGCR